MFHITFIGSCRFLGKHHSVFIRYRVTLVTEVELSYLLYPTGFCIYVRLDNFFEHGFLRSLYVLILFSFLNDLIALTSAEAAGSIRNAGINNGTTLNYDSFSFQLPIKLRKKRIIQIRFNKNVAKTAHCSTIRDDIFHAKTYKTAKRQAIVNLIFNFSVTQTIPSTK